MPTKDSTQIGIVCAGKKGDIPVKSALFKFNLTKSEKMSDQELLAKTNVLQYSIPGAIS
jgi:hypothetical protein